MNHRKAVLLYLSKPVDVVVAKTGHKIDGIVCGIR